MNRFGQTVCLCMIVKNEEHVIRRCLQSVLPILDHWVIVDTGSTDGTQQAIRSFLQDVPGELFERPWVDFATNRTESLTYAAGRATHLFVIDADEVLEYDTDFELPHLEADAYDLVVRSGQLEYYKTQLLRAALPWSYTGVVHEHVTTAEPHTRERLPCMWTMRIPDGARSQDPLTYRKDALLLEGAVLREPGNARHMFYLAQSYADAGEVDLSIDRYRKRVEMGGWPEEVYCALYQIARLQEKKGGDWPPVMEAYLAAYGFHPGRAEPLYRIGMQYQALRQFRIAHLFFARAISLPYPETDILFVEKAVYEYLLPLEYSVACYYIGQYAESLRVCDGLLQNPTLTPEQVEHIVRNRQFSQDAVPPASVENDLDPATSER